MTHDDTKDKLYNRVVERLDHALNESSPAKAAIHAAWAEESCARLVAWLRREAEASPEVVGPRRGDGA
jgi:hypothetical protein